MSKQPDNDYFAPLPVDRYMDSIRKHYTARLSYRNARIISTGLAVSYPIVLGATDYIAPSGNLLIDIGKYVLGGVLAGIATRYHVLAAKRRGITDETHEQMLTDAQTFTDSLKKNDNGHHRR